MKAYICLHRGIIIPIAQFYHQQILFVRNLICQTSVHETVEALLKTKIFYVYRKYGKSLKIPKGSSESVNPRRTDNTIDQKKKDKQGATKHTIGL
jgi:hypothetical protein